MSQGSAAWSRRVRTASGTWRQRVAASLALTMAVTVLQGSETVFAADSPKAGQAAQDKKEYPDQAGDISSARVLARLSGKRVEAL